MILKVESSRVYVPHPSRGVKPIVVSTLLPFSTAQRLAPAPAAKSRSMILVAVQGSSSSSLSSSDALQWLHGRHASHPDVSIFTITAQAYMVVMSSSAFQTITWQESNKRGNKKDEWKTS